jgi:hypothetical protein
MGLSKYVIIPEQRFVRGTIERDDITKHSPMFSLEITELPTGTF